MKRRTFLKNGVSVGSLVALGSCTEQTLKEGKSQPELLGELYHYEEVNLPVRQKLELVEEGVRRADGTDISTPEEFTAYLKNQGFIIEAVSEDVTGGETILSLEYTVDEEGDQGQALEVGIVAGAYAALVEAEYDGEELSASLFEPNGRAFGEFTVGTTAAEEYNEGTTTAATYGKEAMMELQST